MNNKVIPFPSPDENERGEALTEKIIDLCEDEEKTRVIISALLSALVYAFTRLCPVCRRDAAKGIKKALPEMVRDADEIVEEAEEPRH